jgi:hypothetical protein
VRLKWADSNGQGKINMSRRENRILLLWQITLAIRIATPMYSFCYRADMAN